MNNSKKLAIVLLAATGSLIASAQNSALSTAWNYLGDKSLDKAAQAIEPATTHEKTLMKEKTFRYRGMIYQQISNSEDAELKGKYPNAVNVAVESFLKAMELDTKGSYKKENRQNLASLQGLSLNTGNDMFSNKDYAGAIKQYQTCEKIADAFGMVDTNAVFNQALAYDQFGDKETAMTKYRGLLDLGYDKAEVYRYLASLKSQTGDAEGAMNVANEAVGKYPENKELILDLMSYSLEAGKEEVAENAVNLAIEKDPTNPALPSIQGGMFDKKAQNAATAGNEDEMNQWYDKAEAAYKKSIELDENYFDAYYNIGVLYNNRAAYVYEKIKDIKSDSEYMKQKKIADEVYLSAVPFFEKAHAINPEDVTTIKQLVQLYGKTGDEDKYAVMKAKLK